MRTLGRAGISVLALGLIVLAGCQTTKKDAAAKDTVSPGQVIPFSPQLAVSRLYQDGGAYPTLFSSDSYALWVGPELTAARRAESVEAGETIDPEADTIAPIINENFLVIECHLVSYFEDMSIGYDVVGLRGISISLETPDGHRVYPAQSVVGTDLVEESNGALKIYRRTCLLIFPRGSLNLTVPMPGAAPAKSDGMMDSAPPPHGNVRVVLEGFDTRFFFEWFPGMPEVTPSSNPLKGVYAQKAKMKFNDFYGRLKTVAHKFD
ncbi:MAG: hypothetical protein HYV27_09895 [Candidatus Hydrogenedentes bacterium]|nr:hypothetical protein [Candidatus Hydrogenedentota bacterium]